MMKALDVRAVLSGAPELVVIASMTEENARAAMRHDV